MGETVWGDVVTGVTGETHRGTEGEETGNQTGGTAGDTTGHMTGGVAGDCGAEARTELPEDGT